jgi:hypothetical protein
MTELANYLLTLPLAQRHRLRRAIYAEVIGERLPAGAPIESIGERAEELSVFFRNAVARATRAPLQVA